MSDTRTRDRTATGPVRSRRKRSTPIPIDSRIAARRRQVAEVHARSAFTKMIWVMILAVAAGLTIWLFRSPIMAVDTISVTGFDGTELEPILTTSGVVLGRPLITVRSDQVEAALMADTRIMAAEVNLDWPRSVIVEVVPREAVAWANLGGSWGRVGVDGVVIETASEPGAGLPILEVPWNQSNPNESAGSSGPNQLANSQLAPSQLAPTQLVLGGLEFLAALDVLVAQQTVVITSGEELWAMLPSLSIRLGRPIDMTAKAAALEAVLAQGVEPNSVINLLAPTRPAVLTADAAEALTTTTTAVP